MKIYINAAHQIKAVYVNDTNDDTLQEIEVEDDFLGGYCASVIKSYCYHIWTNENGLKCVSVYPYKDYSLLESIQEEHTLLEEQVAVMTSQ